MTDGRHTIAEAGRGPWIVVAAAAATALLMLASTLPGEAQEAGADSAGADAGPAGEGPERIGAFVFPLDGFPEARARLGCFGGEEN